MMRFWTSDLTDFCSEGTERVICIIMTAISYAIWLKILRSGKEDLLHAVWISAIQGMEGRCLWR